MNLKRAMQCSLFLALLGWATSTALADAVGDYKVILDRNPFGLKPPPAPVPPPAPAPPPETPTNYKLSGITALFNPPRAMFVNQPPGKPTPEYISLSEGQVGGGLEVLTNGINIKAGTVRVKISGEERTLSFEKDGLKAPSGPPVMTAPGGPLPFGQPNPVPPTPGGTTALPFNNSGPINYNRGMPSAFPSAVPVALPSGIPAPGNTPVNLSRPVRGNIPLTGGNMTEPPPAQIVDPAEQALRMEINRKLTEKAVMNRDLPPLPSTDLSPLLQPPVPPR